MGRCQRTTTKAALIGLVSTLAACGRAVSQDIFSTLIVENQRSSSHKETSINNTVTTHPWGYEQQGTFVEYFPRTTAGLRGQRARALQQLESNESMSEYLNNLVEASIAERDQQLCNVAYLKTHKTGSTTLSTIFYRYGVRHDRKVARYGNILRPINEAFPKILETCGGRVDVMHLHIGNPYDLQCTWEEAREQYRTIMRDPDNINFVTVVREPREHLLSYFYCCMSPGMGHKSITEYFEELEKSGGKSRPLTNPLSGELGIKTTDDLDSFVKNAFIQMKLIMLTNRFDEGLMVLRNMMGWHMIDMTYLILRETKIPTRRLTSTSKKTKYEKRPHFDELPPEVQTKIDELTMLDKALYEACEEEFDRVIALQADQVQSDLVEFYKLQRQMEEYLNANPTSMANKIYRFTDIFNSYPPAFPF